MMRRDTLIARSKAPAAKEGDNYEEEAGQSKRPKTFEKSAEQLSF